MGVASDGVAATKQDMENLFSLQLFPVSEGAASGGAQAGTGDAAQEGGETRDSDDDALVKGKAGKKSKDGKGKDDKGKPPVIKQV